MNEIVVYAVAGLGIFLFGMSMLEDGLKKAAGSSFKRILRTSTSSVPKSVFFGTLTTAVLQSSSAVTLMVLSFVGAKLITLASAIGVIYGANIGTTMTGWIVAYLGFEVDIGNYALLFLGVGGIILAFNKNNPKISAMAGMIAGFGMVFLGLEYLKESASFIQKSFDMSNYLGYNLAVYVIIGFLLTAIIQSSSAVITIVLSALNSDIITFDIAAVMMIGANIGTTATAMLGAIGGNSDKKRAALSHFVFNIVTAAAAFALLRYLIELTTLIPSISDVPTLRLVMFHTLFNVLGVAIMIPFIGFTARLLLKTFVQKKEELTEYIDKVNVEEVDVAIIAYKKELANYFKRVMRFGLCLFKINPDDVLVHRKKAFLIMSESHRGLDCSKLYGDIKKLEICILRYSSSISQKQLTANESDSVRKLSDSLKELAYAAKILKDISNDLYEFEAEEGYLRENYLFYKQRTIKLFDYAGKYLDGIIDKDDEKAKKVLNSMRLEYNEVTSNIPQAIKEYDISEMVAASLVHVSRGYVVATESIMDAIGTMSQVSEKIEEIQKNPKTDEKTEESEEIEENTKES